MHIFFFVKLNPTFKFTCQNDIVIKKRLIINKNDINDTCCITYEFLLLHSYLSSNTAIKKNVFII